jgi:hypothetical protein
MKFEVEERSNYPGLQVEEDLNSQKKLWKRQRIGRTVWALFILLAIVGLFGEGPLSRTSAKEDELEVQYDRFAHVESKDQFKFDFHRKDIVGGKIHLWFDSDYIKENPIQNVTPDPVSTKLEDKKVVLEFEADQAMTSSSIIVETEASKPGLQRVVLGLVGGPDLKFWKFIWP